MSLDKNKDQTISEYFAEKLSVVSADDLPERAREVAINDFIDIAGLCVTARKKKYIQQLLDGWDAEGDCTAIGHKRTLDLGGASLINGVAIHGEDFDDTLEGAPIRVAAMVIPAVLAACEKFGRSGKDFILGITIGLETICRINHVAAGKMHKQCFHPVGVVGPFGAVSGVCAAMGLDSKQMSAGFGISASLSSGIIEYLSEGAWTKRLHPGWAAQSGIRAALFAKNGFSGPRKIFEGPHNFFRAFAPTAEPDYSFLTQGVGDIWMMERIVFKPYACGTMIHPYIDCMIELANDGIDPDEIERIECETGEGLVHRLWEPLADKHRPTTGYAAKFSMPWCMAVGFFEQDAGLSQFTNEKVKDSKILKLASKIHYKIDPENEYPKNYTGHIKVQFKKGNTKEIRRSHMRGGVREPLTREELISKFYSNIKYGEWPKALGDDLLDFCINIENEKDFSKLKLFRI